MAEHPRYLTARQAADLLGISVPTLYAYVSRGLLRSEPGEGSSRVRRYLVEDVAGLRARKDYRREPAKAAEAALAFGMPVLESAITLIEDGRLYYRGHDVLLLAQERSFEEVAALLWTGEFAVETVFGDSSAGDTLAAALPLPGDLANPIELYQATLALAAPQDLAAHQFTPAAVARTGARILAALMQATTGSVTRGEGTPHPGGGPPPPGSLSVAGSLQRAWAPARPEAAALLSAALILCADHELNVSAFTARCVASAGSPPYAVVIAALSALQGYRHGGCTAQASALLAAAGQGVRPTVAGYLRGGDQIPGFGHPLYPAGDPRGRFILALLDKHYPNLPGVQVAHDLCAAVYAALGQHPTIDLALAALTAAIGAPPHSPLALFALGRTAGWIAHAGEQYALEQLIRPRARYTGPLPR